MEDISMQNTILAKLLLLPLLLCLSLLAHADNDYSNIYIFGDSLSDTGNLAAVYGDLPPPYYQNRITNGPVAVDTLTAKLEQTALASLLGGNNYSVAGAKASGVEQQDLQTQLYFFNERNNYIAPADALYIIFLGGNDIRSASYQPNPVIAESIIETAIAKIQYSIKNLYQNGARSFYVINAPNIGLIPETRLNAEALNNPALITQAEEFTKKYNLKLRQLVESLEEKFDMDIEEFNLFKLFNKIVRKAKKYGFTNSTDACFSSVTYLPRADCDFEQFIFFDEIHPSARVHKLFAEAFYKKLAEEDGDNDNENDDD